MRTLSTITSSWYTPLTRFVSAKLVTSKYRNWTTVTSWLILTMDVRREGIGSYETFGAPPPPREER